jgi:dihydroorotate dehydrogenase subfamily 1
MLLRSRNHYGKELEDNMSLKTNLCGLTLENPLMPGSGPLTGDAERMIFTARLGVGALITKTIAPEGANVPRPCICGTKNMIMNSELWSEHGSEEWVKQFIPETCEAVSTPIIVNIGYTADDIAYLLPQMEPYVSGYELIPRYIGNDLEAVGEIVRVARKLTTKPIWVKMNANLADPVGFATVCQQNGAEGVTAITSLGPNMVIDVKQRKTLIGNEQGFVWTSGPAIKPLALATVSMIKDALPDISIIGCGGVETETDILEFLLAGADAVQMLSTAMLKGREIYRKIIKKLPAALEKNGFNSIEEVKQTQLIKGNVAYEPSFPIFDHDLCNQCDICNKNCPYFALSWKDKKLQVDKNKCFGCGLCQSRCKPAAIQGIL